MRIKLLVLFLIFSFSTLYADISEWKLTKKRNFIASNLYGYINGGAEIFLELGFKELTVFYYSNGKSELVLDVYEMESPESALGIYLQKCGKETPIKQIKARNSGDKFQIISVKDDFLIIINNSEGDSKLLQDMILLVNKFINDNKLSDKKISLLDLLPKKNLIPGSISIFRGHYSLSSIYTFGEGDVFKLKGKIFGIAADYKEKVNKYTLLVIKYNSSTIAKDVFDNIPNMLDKTKKIISKQNNKIIFSDHTKKYNIIEIDNNMIKSKINLNKL